MCVSVSATFAPTQMYVSCSIPSLGNGIPGHSSVSPARAQQEPCHTFLHTGGLDSHIPPVTPPQLGQKTGAGAWGSGCPVSSISAHTSSGASGVAARPLCHLPRPGVTLLFPRGQRAEDHTTRNSQTRALTAELLTENILHLEDSDARFTYLLNFDLGSPNP